MSTLLDRQPDLIAEANEYISTGKNLIKPRYFDNHMIKEYCEDPIKYLIKFVWGLRPKEDNKILEFGKSVHAAMDVWWQTHDVEQCIAKFEQMLPEQFHNNELDQYNLTTGKRLLQRYHTKWIEDTRFKLVEGTCELIFVIPIDDDHYYIMNIDKIVEDTTKDNVLVPVDHKTSGRNRFESLVFDRQFIGYVWGLQQLGFECTNLLIDGIVVAKDDLTLRRLLTEPYLKSMIASFHQELICKIRHIEFDIANNTWAPNRCYWLMESPSMSWIKEIINELAPDKWRAWIESSGWERKIWNPIDKLGEGD